MSRSYVTLGSSRIRSREIQKVAVSNGYCTSTEFHQKLTKPPVGVVLDLLRQEIAFAREFHHPNVMASHSYESVPHPHIVLRNGALGEQLLSKSHLKVTASGLSAVVCTTAEVFERFYAFKVPMGGELVHRPIALHRMVVSPDGEFRLVDLGLAVVPEGEVQRLARSRLWGFDMDTIAYRVANQSKDVVTLCSIAAALLPRTLVYAEHPLPRLLWRGCEVDPERRFKTFAELRDAVERAAPPAKADELCYLATRPSDANDLAATLDVTSTRVSRFARADDPEAAADR